VQIQAKAKSIIQSRYERSAWQLQHCHASSAARCRQGNHNVWLLGVTLLAIDFIDLVINVTYPCCYT